MKGEREQEPQQELPWWYWSAGILVLAVVVAAVVMNYDKLNLPNVLPRGLVEAFKQGGIAPQADPCSPLAEQQIRDHCQFVQGSMYRAAAIGISYHTMAICESDEHDALVILRNERGCSRN